MDTVVDCNDLTIEQGTATGFSFQATEPEALQQAVLRALLLYRKPRRWRVVMRQGMQQDYSWMHSAAAYQELYDELLAAATKFEALTPP